MSTFSRRSILALPLVAVAPLGLLGCESPGKKLTFGKGEVYYKDPVTEAQAKKLGDFLKGEVEYFNDSDERSVQVIKDGGTFVVRFVVKDGAENDEKALVGFKALTIAFSSMVFEGAMTRVELTNDRLKTMKALDAASAAPPAATASAK